jgi:hypothetical protein
MAVNGVGGPSVPASSLLSIPGPTGTDSLNQIGNLFANDTFTSAEPAAAAVARMNLQQKTQLLQKMSQQMMSMVDPRSPDAQILQQQLPPETFLALESAVQDWQAQANTLLVTAQSPADFQAHLSMLDAKFKVGLAKALSAEMNTLNDVNSALSQRLAGGPYGSSDQLKGYVPGAQKLLSQLLQNQNSTSCADFAKMAANIFHSVKSRAMAASSMIQALRASLQQMDADNAPEDDSSDWE